jgi:hypothetical protein
MGVTIVFTHFKISEIMPKLEIENEFNLLEKKEFSKVSNDNLTTEDIIKESRVDCSERLEPPPVCLGIEANNSNSIIATMGTFSVIIGKAKSRKTFLTSLLVSAFLRNDNSNSLVKGTLISDKKKVIFFDTEQPRYKVAQIQSRILNLAKRNTSDDFSIFCLRKYSTTQRIDVIKEVIYKTQGLGVIIIDGIRDLVFDINNSQEAVETTGRLMKWTEELNIHCMCVIHQNKGDNNARGHLGTELVNKGETIISVTKQEKDKSISIVEPEQCREKDFEPFAIRIDDNSLPYIDENWKPKDNDGKKKTLSPHDFILDVHRTTIVEIFELQPQFKYTEMKKRIKTIWNKNGVEFGDNKALDFLSFYQNEKLIINKNPSIKGKGIYEKYI